MVEKTLDWDNNPDSTNPDGKYMFYVRAIDPSGEIAEVEVNGYRYRRQRRPQDNGERGGD